MLSPSTSHPYIITPSAAPAFVLLAFQWIEEDAPRLRFNTSHEYIRVLRREVLPRIGDLPADQIKRLGLIKLFHELTAENGPGIARNAKWVINAIFNWAMAKGLLEGPNPTLDIKLPRPHKRERWLSEPELRAVWLGCANFRDYGRIVRSLILTGCRREEIGSLVWPEVNIAKAQLELPATRTKNGRKHIVPLSKLALEQLPPQRESGPYVFGPDAGARRFSGWSWCREELPRRIGPLEGGAWTLHDLRHTFSTHMREKELASKEIVEACLNHVEGGMAGHYNHAEYAAQKRAAFERWSAEITRIVGL